MPGRFVLACLAATFWLAAASPARSQGMFDRSVEETTFELSVSQQFDESSKPTIVVVASVPYRKLVFFLRGRQYEARYRVYLELKERGGKSAPGRVWEESVAVDSFGETTSAARFAATRRTFPVDPGEYTAIVTIEVIDTSRRFKEEQAVRVVGEGEGAARDIDARFLHLPRGFPLHETPGRRDRRLDVPLLRRGGIAHQSGRRLRRFRRMGARRFRRRRSRGAARGIPSFSRPGCVTRAALSRSIREKTLDRGGALHSALCLDIGLDNLPIGEYELDAVIETAGGAQRSQSTGRFVPSLQRGAPPSRVDDLVDLLSLVADEKEARAVAEAPAAERVRAWALFWRKLDPTPATESNEAFGDFLQRLRYVLKSFSKHQPGWRTDMGEIYIQNGRPDKIEDRQEPRMGRNYQLWYYNSKGVVFIFEDSIGSGEYHLLSTEMM